MGVHFHPEEDTEAGGDSWLSQDPRLVPARGGSLTSAAIPESPTPLPFGTGSADKQAEWVPGMLLGGTFITQRP